MGMRVVDVKGVWARRQAGGWSMGHPTDEIARRYKKCVGELSKPLRQTDV